MRYRQNSVSSTVLYFILYTEDNLFVMNAGKSLRKSICYVQCFGIYTYNFFTFCLTITQASILKCGRLPVIKFPSQLQITKFLNIDILGVFLFPANFKIHTLLTITSQFTNDHLTFNDITNLL